MTEDLASWLLEQIAEDERVAREAASPSPWVVDDQQRDDRAIYGAARGATVAYDPSGDEDSKLDFAHIVRWDPARVLAECAAKRRVVEEYREAQQAAADDPDDISARIGMFAFGRTLMAFGEGLADRPGYRPEWKP